MKKLVILGSLSVLIIGVVVGWGSIREVGAKIADIFYGDPDMGPFDPGMSREEFMSKRSDAIALKRGVEKDKPFNPQLRVDAVKQLEQQEQKRSRMPASPAKTAVVAAWTEIGPNPIPNGQVVGGLQLPVSGRTIAIAVHPTNPNIVYVGTAQGGLYRTTNGGTTWTPLMDNALSLAIGAVAIAPSQPETIYVGTGEPQFSGDSFFGVGVYRIDNASSANPTITGPLNKDATNADIFTGRGVGKIIVHPTDPATIFVASTSGFGGISGSANNVLPSRGIYRSTNATAASPTFAKLTGLNAGANSSVRDIVIDPLNSNLLIANEITGGGTGGIYVSTDALSATPTFTQRVIFNSGLTSLLTAEFAIQHTAGPNPTIYAATGNPASGSTTAANGRVMMSTDGGTTWTTQITNNFCGGQCFYDIAVAVDPTDATKVYVGGTGAVTFASSSNSGVAFTASQANLHTDSQVIAVAPSLPSTIYFGSDGGIYKSTDSGATWSSFNNVTFRATQFQSIALHPTDPNFTIGGTQDNGTELRRSDSTWNRADFGDGGNSVIDQNATNTSTVSMYHTYFNQTGSLLGFARNDNGESASEGAWQFFGCGGTANGINCADTAVLFYAPLVRGPGNPNTIYYGTDRLYRSADKGVTATAVSQGPITASVAISAIGIAPQNDNIRIVGQNNGGLFATTTGAATLTDIDVGGAVPNNYIARAVVDPNNVNTAYVTLSVFGVVNVWKTTNLSNATPTWASVANGLPLVPVSAFVIDPLNSNNLFAGTDIGVYGSVDAGANWLPLGTGLPRVAVFDMAITNITPRKLRIATHGRGMWEYPLATRRARADFDGDGRSDISVYRPSEGNWYLNRSTAGFGVVRYGGAAGDVLIPGDYDGDGKADFAIWRPSDNPALADFYILNSNGFTISGYSHGLTTDIPVAGDFDGDGKNDIVVFRPSTGVWYLFETTTQTTRSAQFGLNGDIPMAIDGDGNGKADLTVFRPSNNTWYIAKPTGVPAQNFESIQFGLAGDILVPADYDGDNKDDLAVFRPSNGTWYILRSTDGGVSYIQFGASGDVPVPGDYDGDGKNDVAVYRAGTWYLNGSTAGFSATAFGLASDTAIPAKYHP